MLFSNTTSLQLHPEYLRTTLGTPPGLLRNTSDIPDGLPEIVHLEYLRNILDSPDGLPKEYLRSVSRIFQDESVFGD